MTGRPRPSPTHLNKKGEAQIVDIGGKQPTRRRAVAQSRLVTSPDVADAILGSALMKGDAVAVARVAGIMAAKKTSELIPLCHPIPISSVAVDIVAGAAGEIVVTATVETVSATGVEMEALTAASLAALTLYDMAKSMDRAMTIADTWLVEKSGGKSGDYVRTP